MHLKKIILKDESAIEIGNLIWFNVLKWFFLEWDVLELELSIN